MAEYSSLLSDLSENITNEDLEQLKSACKEDIPEDQSNNITSSKEWFSYLEKNDKLAQGEKHRLRTSVLHISNEWIKYSNQINQIIVYTVFYLPGWKLICPVCISNKHQLYDMPDIL